MEHFVWVNSTQQLADEINEVTLRKYEILDEFIKNGWYVSEDDLVNYAYIEDIRGYKNIEDELLKYMSDLSSPEPEWKCEIPL